MSLLSWSHRSPRRLPPGYGRGISASGDSSAGTGREPIGATNSPALEMSRSGPQETDPVRDCPVAYFVVGPYPNYAALRRSSADTPRLRAKPPPCSCRSACGVVIVREDAEMAV